MSTIRVEQKLKKSKKAIQEIGTELLAVADRFEADKETRVTLNDQLEHINENFLFVIIGEVNAGKSSFINALLEQPLCQTSHEICTQDVQKIVYGETEIIEKDEVKRIIKRTYPAEVLKEITIVDTPGTNSRELDHQVITEQFIPLSNLVVFVFQTDNIHVQSAWELFDKIKEKWSKKIVFVLTKSDRYTPEEQKNYKSTLTRYAEKEGIQNPIIFATSSKQELEGTQETSGFKEIRDFVNNHILDTAAKDKVKDDLVLLNKLMSNVDGEFALRREKFDRDKGTRNRIQQIIDSKESLAYSNIQSLTQQCLRTYDNRTDKTIDEVKKGIGFFNLTFKSIKSIFGGETTKDWLEQLNKEHVKTLNDDINHILQGGADTIKSDISYMVMGVKSELDNLQELKVRPSEMFSKLDRQRSDILDDLKQNLRDFIDKSPVFNGEQITGGKSVDYSGVNIAGGVAAVGTTIAMISNIALIDLTGGIATALALMVAGGIATTRKGKYIGQIKDTLTSKRHEFKDSLEQNLKSYFKQIKDQVTGQFSDFDHHLASEEIQLDEYAKIARSLKNKLEETERSLV